MNIKTVMAVTAAVIGISAFGFTPPAEKQEEWEAGQVLTNDALTAAFKKFGKIKAKEAVTVDLTENVMRHGKNLWSDDVDEHPDDIYGFGVIKTNGVWKVKDPVTGEEVVAAYYLRTEGHEFVNGQCETAPTGDSGFSYFGQTRDRIVFNVPIQEGTNKTGRANAPAIVLPGSNNVETVQTRGGTDFAITTIKCPVMADREWTVKFVKALTGKSDAEVTAALEAITRD